MGKILGLDLGITSVGWGIIDDDYNIINYGVRLNDEANAENNKKRRTQRGIRRRVSRRQNRITALKYLLKNNNIIDDIIPIQNIYEVRVKGLTQKLTYNELANVLINIAKHRGLSLDIVTDEKEDDENFGAILSNNTKRLKENNIYVCQDQLRKLKEGKLRDHNNIYHMDDYINELKKILSNQGLNDEINDKILKIISRQRLYSEGPGSKEYPTPYGSYRYVIENGNNVIKKVNLIDVMRGKCTIFPEEFRIAKNSYSAYLFNFLNDINNLTYKKNGELLKISKEQKVDIINNYINKDGKFTISKLLKYLDIEKNDISGCRIDKKGNLLITEFDSLKEMFKLDINKNIITNRKYNDLIIDILTKYKSIKDRKDKLQEINKEYNVELSEDEIVKLSEMKKITGYHSLSEKAINEILPELIDTNDNQMQIIEKNKLNKIITKKNKSKNILFDETAILSPVAKRVHRQAIRVVNELRHEYGEFDSIIIETTRAKNEKEEKEEIIKIQKINEEQKKYVDDLIIEMNKNPNQYNLLTKLKIRLYKEQNGKTMYDLYEIDLDTLLNDPTAYEIEHIIPYSISQDNSLNNKCLVSKEENQKKGKMTPFGYYSSGKSRISFKEFEEFVNRLNISNKKKENLLNQNDIVKIENAKGFIERNLIDTSYSIRTVMTTLKNFFHTNDIKTNVFTIKGKQTHTFRTRAGLNKDRDEFIHHAVDALIISAASKQSIFKKIYSYDKSVDDTLDINDDILDDSKFIQFVKSLKTIESDHTRFSYKIDTKTNRAFSDETIYSTRTKIDENGKSNEYIIAKYKDIYSNETAAKIKKLFEKNESNKLLVYDKDKETYNILKEIYEHYKHENNPFAKYKEEHGFIRKYSKKGNGPIIMDLKYYDKKLGSHMELAKTKNKRVVLLKIKSYRIDVYLGPNGDYRFLAIRYVDIESKEGINYIDNDKYNLLKKNKKITNEYEFKFSLYKHNIIKLYDNENTNGKFYKYSSVNSDLDNTIELKEITKTTVNRIKKTIGKNTKCLEKYNVSIIGKYKKVEKEPLKLKW